LVAEPSVSVKFSRLDLDGAGTGEDDARGHNEAASAWENDPMRRPGPLDHRTPINTNLLAYFPRINPLLA
jgi:hypothetical protein